MKKFNKGEFSFQYEVKPLRACEALKYGIILLQRTICTAHVLSMAYPGYQIYRLNTSQRLYNQ